jgi:hypothetical protein
MSQTPESNPDNAPRPAPPNWGRDALTRWLDQVRRNQWGTFALLPDRWARFSDIDRLFERMTTDWRDPSDILAAHLFIRCCAAWNAGAPMDDANFNRRQTIRVGASVAYAQVGVIGFDGPIDLQSLRLYGLPEAAPAVLNGTPLLTGALFGSGRREFAAEVSWDLPSLAPGATALIDVTVNGARAGDLAQASLVSSTRFIELDAAVWSNNTVRVMARNISAATFDLAAATLSIGVTKRRVP